MAKQGWQRRRNLLASAHVAAPSGAVDVTAALAAAATVAAAPASAAAARESCPLVAIMENNNELFQECILQPLRATYAKVRAITDHVSQATDLPEQLTQTLGTDLWELLDDAKSIDKRFKSQLVKVARQL